MTGTATDNVITPTDLSSIPVPTPAPADRRVPRAGISERLITYAAIHDAMVRDAARLVRRIEGLTPDQARTVGTWWERFEAEIEHHHVREDELVFPLVAHHDPGFRADELVADHVQLDRDMAAVRQGLDAVTRTGTDLLTARQALATDVRQLRYHLGRHLALEEQLVFPILAMDATDAEIADLERRLREGSGLGELSFTLPWLLDELDPELRARADVPWLLRVLDRWFWERRYARLAAPLRGA